MGGNRLSFEFARKQSVGAEARCREYRPALVGADCRGLCWRSD